MKKFLSDGDERGEMLVYDRASQISHVQGSSGGLFKAQIPGSYPEIIVQQSHGLRICISDKLLGDAAVTCRWSTF